MSKASGSIDLKSLKVAGDGAAKYITDITSEGIFISPSSQSPTSSATGNSVQIDGTGMTIYKGGISVAMYGDTARIGKKSSKHAMIDDEGFSMWASDSLIAQLAYGYTMTDSGSALVMPYYVLGQQDAAVSYTELRQTGASQPGIIVIYEGAYYISTSAIAQNENWTPSHWKLLHGAYSLTEGRRCVATGSGAHAEGMGTTAGGMGSHAEGYFSIASGIYSHAEGAGTKASNEESHSEGYETIASGTYSHAEGLSSKASGTESHAEGLWTEASGKASHAGGCSTIATRYAQTVIGAYNVQDGSGESTKGNYVFIIGNGTGVSSSQRSNALTVDWNGNVDIVSGAKYKINGIALAPSDLGEADFITSQGSSGSWYYRKWNSGKVEAWYRDNVSCSAATAVNNVYRSSYSLSIPSGIFSSAPNVNISIDQNASTLMTAMGYASSSTAISGYVFRTGSQTSTYNTRVAVYAWTN